jgi:TetR/AcrR family transcriptional repressor of nem operon
MFRKILGDVSRICPGGVFSLEWNTLPKEVKDEARGLLSDHRKFLEELLKAGRKSGDIRAQGSVEEQIAFVGACLQGALQLARVQDNVGVFNAIARQLRAAILES